MPQAMPLSDHISQSANRAQAQRVNKARYGNGYEQRVPAGTNSKFGTWNIVYENLDPAERSVVVSALDAVGAVDYFTWTPHGESVEKKWRVTEDGYTEQWTSGIHSTISFTVEQYF